MKNLQAAQLWEKIRNEKSEKEEENEQFMPLGGMEWRTNM